MHAFVYGTLTDPETVAEVVDSYVFVGAATCEGLHIVQGDYPTLLPGGRAAGRLLRTDEVDALDAYEAVEDGLYTRVAVPLRSEESGADNGAADGARTAPVDFPDTAAVYVGDPDRLGVQVDAEHGGEAWPGDGDLAERVRRYVRGHGVEVVAESTR